MTLKFSYSKTRQNGTFFGIFNKFLTTQNVNVARFARNVQWDIFCDFQTPYAFTIFIEFQILIFFAKLLSKSNFYMKQDIRISSRICWMRLFALFSNTVVFLFCTTSYDRNIACKICVGEEVSSALKYKCLFIFSFNFH